MKSSFFNINNEEFQFEWLFRYGFWRIIWFCIKAWFGLITINKEPYYDNTYVSYGINYPLKELHDKGYKTKLLGYVLYQPILFYYI